MVLIAQLNVGVFALAEIVKEGYPDCKAPSHTSADAQTRRGMSKVAGIKFEAYEGHIHTLTQ